MLNQAVKKGVMEGGKCHVVNFQHKSSEMLNMLDLWKGDTWSHWGSF